MEATNKFERLLLHDLIYATFEVHEKSHAVEDVMLDQLCNWSILVVAFVFLICPLELC